MAKLKIKKGDTVEIIAGDDKGKKSKSSSRISKNNASCCRGLQTG